MKFGSISYLNLLPFQIYLKRVIQNSQTKQIINYKKDTPSSINIKFKTKKIDAAFISSIKSKGCSCTNLGIIAKSAVYSVFVLPNEQMFDVESDTSNALSIILNKKGKVVIGDKALKLYLKNPNMEFTDLAKEWQNRYKLPFVFARLCYNKHSKKIKKLANNFNPHKEKIPQHYLKKEANKKGLSTKELIWYLNFISYKIGYKEKKSLKKFLKLVRKNRL